MVAPPIGLPLGSVRRAISVSATEPTTLPACALPDVAASWAGAPGVTVTCTALDVIAPLRAVIAVVPTSAALMLPVPETAATVATVDCQVTAAPLIGLPS